MPVTSKIRSDRVPKMYTPGMKKMVEEAQKRPGMPVSLAFLRQKYCLKRNDIINIRRQIEKIIQMRGPIRYIEPDRTHVVFISDEVPEEEINAILAAASAVAHLTSKKAKLSETLTSDITDIICKELLVHNRL